MPQAFPPASHAPGNTPEAQKRHRKPQKSWQKPREYGDTDPQRKTAPAAVKMPKKRDRPPPAPTRARAFIPRAVVFSLLKDHQETVRSASPSPSLPQIVTACQAIPRADRPPAAEDSGGHPSNRKRQEGERGEESPGAACSGREGGQRRRLPPHHPATGQPSGEAEGQRSRAATLK